MPAGGRGGGAVPVRIRRAETKMKERGSNWWPQCAIFVTSLWRQEEDHWRGEIDRVVAGALPRNQKPQWAKLAERLTRLVDRRDGGHLTTLEFLRAVAHNYTM